MLSLKYFVLVAVGLLLLSGLGDDWYSFDRLLSFGIPAVVIAFISYVAISFLVPTLLPWLPGRSFSAKGAWLGVVLAGAIGWLATSGTLIFPGYLNVAGWALIVMATSSFLAMNFTGSSTFTSLSGVLKEMRIAVPIQLAGAVIGLVLWVTGLYI